jgi:hypothetical protein
MERATKKHGSGVPSEHFSLINIYNNWISSFLSISPGGREIPAPQQDWRKGSGFMIIFLSKEFNCNLMTRGKLFITQRPSKYFLISF